MRTDFLFISLTRRRYNVGLHPALGDFTLSGLV